ncbi:glycosyltransferase involved in cell wall biosynthesis [Desulfomicrobium macestii]|uniref:Glycosyltransferase involved in cell wall biosynthesis n=1 Tax=Desulfomicrobium macestii TaxID=90731 RepID=A0ABR9H778_9BACT|nr:glycosyltransferase [Desulfomicrobium macestii]MBE1426377.1 glycosyltransferase involved in cell wall biosynthesis [Desulfomicrobium macestii]
MLASSVRLAIITATFNTAEYLPRLIDSLKSQSDPDFIWIVADGGSTDETLALLRDAAKSLNVTVDTRSDFGIYDALNRSVRMADSDYYIVIGADDEFFPDAVAQYKVACRSTNADFVTALVEGAGRICGVRKRKWEWLYGPFAHVGCHAVGLAIRSSLHERFGYYSRSFPIAADQLFILEAIHGGATVCEQSFIAGKYYHGGFSGQDILGTLVEGFRVQVRVGHGLLLQLILLVARILKNWSRIKVWRA